MSNGTWVILGPGSLGRLLATHLAGHVPLVMVGRQASENPLFLSTPEGKSRIRSLPRVTAQQAPGHPVMVHITTKAYATQTALEELSPHIPDETPLVLWQNGYQVQEPLTRSWPGPVLCATTSEGAYTKGEDTVVHAGYGHTYIGHLDGRYEAFAQCIATTLTVAGLHADPCNDIRIRLWHKLAVNAAINPLVAQYRIRNGQLRDHPYRHRVMAVIEEVATVMAAERIAPPEEGWAARTWSVIEGTANNRASMLQDVLAGRPTERDAILGPLLEASRKHNLDVPTLSELYRDTPG